MFWIFASDQLLIRGQEVQKAVLIDEYHMLTCDELRSRVDILLKELASFPNSNGLVVIHSVKDRPFDAYLHKYLLKAYIDIRNFEPDRIVFLRGRDEGKLRVQFWKVPADAPLPVSETEQWDYKIPQTINPFIFHKKSWIGEVCPETFSIGFYSNFLVANTDLRGHLVIYEKSTKNYNKTKQKLIEELEGKYKIPRNRLKFFYLRSKTPVVEFWYVPSKQMQM